MRWGDVTLFLCLGGLLACSEGSSSGPPDASVAPDGPRVTVGDAAAPGPCTASSGASWTFLGSPTRQLSPDGGQLEPHARSSVLLDDDGTAHAAFAQLVFEIPDVGPTLHTVQGASYESDAWHAIAGSGGGLYTLTSTAFHEVSGPHLELSAGGPIVTFTTLQSPADVASTYVRRFDGTSWQDLGGSPAFVRSDAARARSALFLDGSDIWLGLYTSTPQGGSFSFHRFEGGAWRAVGPELDLGFVGPAEPAVSFVVDGLGRVVVVWAEAGSPVPGSLGPRTVRARRLEGTSWTTLPSPGALSILVNGGGALDLARDGSGDPVVAMVDNDGAGFVVRKLDGDSWAALFDGAGRSLEQVQEIALAASNDGIALAALQYGSGLELRVFELNGAQLTEPGVVGSGVTECIGSEISLSMNAAGGLLVCGTGPDQQTEVFLFPN